ncbi:hypothetical protein ID866_6795 [Astraeus odoratus]|nr:hypothetical protein ID866_6795 [Astraeus odoratus]
MKLATLPIVALVHGALGRIITVSNLCDFTIWPAMFTASGTGPSYPNGWEAAPATTVNFVVPDNWTSARIWVTIDRDDADVILPLVGRATVLMVGVMLSNALPLAHRQPPLQNFLSIQVVWIIMTVCILLIHIHSSYVEPIA